MLWWLIYSARKFGFSFESLCPKQRLHVLIIFYLLFIAHWRICSTFVSEDFHWRPCCYLQINWYVGARDVSTCFQTPAPLLPQSHSSNHILRRYLESNMFTLKTLFTVTLNLTTSWWVLENVAIKSMSLILVWPRNIVIPRHTFISRTERIKIWRERHVMQALILTWELVSAQDR